MLFNIKISFEYCKKLTVLIGIFFLFKTNAISQQDSAYEKMLLIHKRSINNLMKLAMDDGKKTIGILDSISSELNKKGIYEIVSLIHFRHIEDYGCILWKEGEVIKGIQITHQYNLKGERISTTSLSKNKELIVKKFKDKMVNNPSIDSLFSYSCDLVSIIKGFELSSISSHPWVIYFRKENSNHKEDIFFSTDDWPINENLPCLTGLMEIKWLHTRKGKK